MKRLLRLGVVLVGLLPAYHARAAENIPAAVSSAAEASHVFCSGKCFLRSLYVTTGAVAGYLMTFNATSAPGDGAVTPRECVYVPANTTIGLDFGETMEDYNVGLTAVFSSAGCFTKTASATAFFKARKQ
jgi:hypothetical protein